MQPKVSVIIPCYNNAQFLNEAIVSIVMQDYDNLEIIVVDDGSIDNTENIMESFSDRVHYYKITHAGAGAARNYGVQQATGDYLAFLDADDIWPEKKLEQQMKCLLNEPLDAAFTAIIQFLEPTMLDKKIKPSRKIMPGLCASTLLIKKNVFREIGYFKTEYFLGEFIEWFMRAQQHGLRFKVLDNIMTRRRIHGHNTSLIHKNQKKDYLAIIKSKLEEKQEYATT